MMGIQFQFVMKSNQMDPQILNEQLQHFCSNAGSPLSELLGFRHAKELSAGSNELSNLELFKGKALALVLLAQAADAIRSTMLQQFKLVEAAEFSINQGRLSEMEKAWHAEGNRRNARSKALKKAIPEFTKMLRNTRESHRSSVRRNLDEFQGEINTYVSSEFVEDDSNSIWNLSDLMANSLRQRALSFSDRVFPSLNEFCQTATDQASVIIGSKLPVPVKVHFNGHFKNVNFIEDNAFNKVMGLNSALRVGDMNMDVMGFGTLGRWLSVGKAPQYVREQHIKKNSAQIRNFSRQFTTDLFHDISLSLERLERYLVSSLDIALKCNSSMLAFLARKSFRSVSSPQRLDFHKIASLGTDRYEKTIVSLDAFREQLNDCYKKLPGLTLNEAKS